MQGSIEPIPEPFGALRFSTTVSHHTHARYGGNMGPFVRECELPAGDYAAQHLKFRFGRLEFSLSNNYHRDGRRGAALGKVEVFPIGIRKDRPYVLDFAGHPEVMFASPAKDRSFALGAEIVVMAVLCHPPACGPDRHGPRAFQRAVKLQRLITCGLPGSFGSRAVNGCGRFSHR